MKGYENNKPYKAWIVNHPCTVSDMGCWGAIQPAHVKSRGAGGQDISNIVPLCTAHHSEQHNAGIKSFQLKYDLDLPLIASELGRIWVEELDYGKNQ